PLSEYPAVWAWEVMFGRSWSGHDPEDFIDVTYCLRRDGRAVARGLSCGLLEVVSLDRNREETIVADGSPPVTCVGLSGDGRWLPGGFSWKDSVVASDRIQLWELLSTAEATPPADWDERARPQLEMFLTLHSLAGLSPAEAGHRSWTDDEFQTLL